MTKSKYNKTEPLTHIIGVRVSEQFYNKLENLRKNSNCQTLAEFARLILQQEKIIWYHKNESADALAVELAAIRKEIKSIGLNINQITRYFNSSAIPNQKIFYALKILDDYKKTSTKMDQVLTVLDKVIQ